MKSTRIVNRPVISLEVPNIAVNGIHSQADTGEDDSEEEAKEVLADSFLDRIIREEAIMAGAGQQGSVDFDDKAESDQNT